MKILYEIRDTVLIYGKRKATVVNVFNNGTVNIKYPKGRRIWCFMLSNITPIHK